MARPTNQQRAIQLANQLGVELDDEGSGVEIWSRRVHLSDDAPAHVHIPQRESFPTESALWGYIFDYLRELTPCDPDCVCWED